MTKKPTKEELEKTRELMGALVRMPPKSHEDLKLSKKTGAKSNKVTRPSSRGAPTKPKSA
jgi:hypothetical protein